MYRFDIADCDISVLRKRQVTTDQYDLKDGIRVRTRRYGIRRDRSRDPNLRLKIPRQVFESIQRLSEQERWLKLPVSREQDSLLIHFLKKKAAFGRACARPGVTFRPPRAFGLHLSWERHFNVIGTLSPTPKSRPAGTSPQGCGPKGVV